MKITRKIALSASIVFATFFGYVHAANAANILLIESYHADYAWDVLYKKALNEHLAEHTITTFEMDTKRVPKEMYQQKADEAWAKYNELKPDYVILGDDNALKYLGKKLAKTRTPTIFLGINNNPRDYFENGQIPPNFSGVLERPLLNRSVVQIKKLLPKTQNVLILFDDGYTSKSSVTPEMKSGKIGNIFVKTEMLGTEKQWKMSVKYAKEEGFDAIIVGLYHTLKDENGEHVPAPDILKWTNENTDIPLFAFWNFAVGKEKTVGGMVLDGYKMGEAAAKVVKEVIAGGHPGVKIDKEGTPTFSTSELSRWNIVVPDTLHRDSIFYD